MPVIIPLDTAAKIIETNISNGPIGVINKSIIFPCIFILIIELEEFEKEFCSELIIIKPGARKFIYKFASSLSNLLPITIEKTNININELKIGPIIVWAGIFRNLNVSFIYKVLRPEKLINLIFIGLI